jgi:hypothetical protein
MAHMEHIDRLISHYEQEAIGTPITCTEKQLPYRLVEQSTLRSQRTSLGMSGKTTHALPRTANPLLRRMWRLVANVAIRCPEISFRLGCEDHAVSHLSVGIC